MSRYNYFNDVQAYEQLEAKRSQIQMDPAYQKWVQELHISQSYVEPEGFIRAKLINEQYDYTNRKESSFLNFLKIKGIWS